MPPVRASGTGRGMPFHKLFAKHGVSVTIITTHANASTFQKTIDSDFNSGYSIKTHLIQFPSVQVGLPHGVENFKDATSLEMIGKIKHGISMLQDPTEILLQDLQPDCLVTDMMLPWTVEAAAKLGVPRYRPHDNLVSDTHKFTIPGLPHTIEMAPLQLSDFLKEKNATTAYFESIFGSEKRSYGTLYNSFHELESDYEKLSQTTMGIKSWCVGPFSTWINKDDHEEKGNRGHIEKEGELLNWLKTKSNDSVLYVCFGSLARLSHEQLVEIAYGLAPPTPPYPLHVTSL
ncbi:soyasapogenol B glucuronide galactosyltransferase-like [Vicia villosa]|uniref:soyasapogenol B glucuronide galactosyltransferase-like n=1 Tax=Vicia villosa TaxID=3911 RepID=UPI00273C2EB4|nr:soyasapogenol B glucuronide galactosyltransferase-like [Vicia villosa]